MPRKHHVVSAGYLRFFGEERKPGKFFVRLLSLDRKVNEVVPVEKILWRRGLNTAYLDGAEDDVLEDEFARVERDTLPVIARVIKGEWRADWHAHVKALMALHLARSYRFREMIDRAVEVQFSGPLASMSEEKLTAAFLTQYGREPEPGELDRIVRDHVGRWRASNVFYVSESGDTYNKAYSMFEGNQIELVKIRPPAPHLLTGDGPLVVAAGDDWKRTGVAIGDADLIYMPLSPTLAASLITGNAPRSGEISRPSAARKLNHAIRRNSDRFLVAHPQTDWKRALGWG